MGRHEGEAMGRPTDLVLDASLPKHKNIQKILSLRMIWKKHFRVKKKMFA